MQPNVRLPLFVIVSILLGVHSAHAQGFVAPSLGATLGNPSGEGRADFGASLGWVAPREPIGVELDVVYAPSFFGGAESHAANSVTTVMGNVIFAGGGSGRYGFGRRRPSSVRPYVSGGFGVMHEVVTTAAALRVANDDFGMNLGAGVMTFSRRSVGVRGDVRYFRNLVNSDAGANIEFGAFHFWRASIGLLFAF
jgi:hypothetical protein